MDLLSTQLVLPEPFYCQATDNGKIYESVATEKFRQFVGRTADCGLFVNQDYLSMAASRDGVLLSINSVPEVSCPCSAKDKKFHHISVPYLKESNGALTLNKKHSYYYQVQGQLACASADSCYFVCSHKMEDVLRDEFICDMRNNLEALSIYRYIIYIHEDYTYENSVLSICNTFKKKRHYRRNTCKGFMTSTIENLLL